MATPKLRFKEFASKVEVKKLGNISNIVVGFVGTVSDQYCDQNEGVPFVRTQNVREGYFSIENLEYVTKEFHKKNKKSQIFNGDVLIARVGANMGMVCAVENLNTEANCANVIIIKKNSQLNSQYLSLFLNSENGQKQIHSGGAGGAQAVFNTTLAKEISFPYFPLQEQTKIASFLSAVDEKISQLTQKHALLSQYKQGMMQKLFNQEIRFKADDGSEFGEWEETVLEKIGAFLKGKGISKADIVEDGFTPCIRYGELYTHYGEVISKVISATNLEIENLILSKANDVLIPASGETQIDIATASCVLHDDVALSGDLNIFRTKENGVFLSYLIRSHLKMQIAQLAQGNSVVHLYSSQLKGVRLNLPCLEEQTKIANFLSAIDQKIEVVVQQIEQAKQWKKGLLQQMFV